MLIFLVVRLMSNVRFFEIVLIVSVFVNKKCRFGFQSGIFASKKMIILLHSCGRSCEYRMR
jgi:hypothetical protein